MRQPSPDERNATIVIIVAAFWAAVLGAAYDFGAHQGRGQPLPARTWKHSVAFRLHSQEHRP
jgi:hypothetical protein